MKEQKIKSIESVFSHLDVCVAETDYYEFSDNRPHTHRPGCIKEILYGYNKMNVLVYAGYNFNDKLLFEVPTQGVIAYYFTEDELKQENETK